MSGTDEGRVGPWILLAPLGAGGQATVHRARHALTGEAAAVKLIRPDAWADGAFRARFRREREALRLLVHPHVVPLIDAGETAQGAYLAMPIASEGTLADRLATGRLESAEALRILAAVAGALDAAHAAGRLHRDVKPANVLLSGAAVWLSDFGLGGRIISLAGDRGPLIGTPGYLAPELLAGGAATPAADRYALAVMAAEALAGTLAASRSALARGRHPDPRRRPRTAADLVAGVAGALAHEGGRGALWAPTRRLVRADPGRPRRRALAPAAALAAGVALMAGAAGALTLGLPAPAPSAPSTAVAPAPAPSSVPGPDGVNLPARAETAVPLPGLGASAADVARLDGLQLAAVRGAPAVLAAAARAHLDADGFQVLPVGGEGTPAGWVASRPFGHLRGGAEQWALVGVAAPGGPRLVIARGLGGAPYRYVAQLAAAQPDAVVALGDAGL